VEDVQSLNHTKWECKYHVVWIPKYRKKTLYVELWNIFGFNIQGPLSMFEE
jgi:putative transposase